MKRLKVIRIQPNPRGKEASRWGGATIAQLGAEWVDIQNDGVLTEWLSGVEVNHALYKENGEKRWQGIAVLSGSLDPGKIARVHSGKTRPLTVLRREDLAGADVHFFTERDGYVWNKDEGDAAALWDMSEHSWIDSAAYAPNPPEGAILCRVGDQLVPPRRTGSGRRTGRKGPTERAPPVGARTGRAKRGPARGR